MSNFITDGVKVAQLEEAVRSLEDALESDPSDADARSALEHARRSLACSRARLARSSKGFVDP